MTPVYCYTDYPTAELFVNGKSQGRITKSDTARLDRYRLRWRNVVYQPGELKVVVYDENGNKAGQQIVRTAGKPKRLLLEPERKTIKAYGDVCQVVSVSIDGLALGLQQQALGLASGTNNLLSCLVAVLVIDNNF